MFQTSRRCRAEADRVADGLGRRTGEDQRRSRRGRPGRGRPGSPRACTGRSFQNGRPSSISYMRFIARPNEPDVAGGRPERGREAEDERHTGRACGGRPGDWSVGSEGARRPSRRRRARRMPSSVSTVCCPCPNRPTSDSSAISGGEQREHGVVGQGGGEVGALVLGELAQRLAQDVPPRRLGQVGGRVRLEVVVGRRDVPAVGGMAHACRCPIGRPTNRRSASSRSTSASGGQAVRPRRATA